MIYRIDTHLCQFRRERYIGQFFVIESPPLTTFGDNMNWINSLTRCDTSWETDDKDGNFKHDVASKLECIEIPSKIGECKVSIYTLPFGLTISTLDHTFNSATDAEIHPFMDVEQNYSEPSLIITCVTSGQLILRNHVNGIKYSVNSEAEYFQLTKEVNFSLDIDTKENISLVKIALSKTFLNGLLGKEMTNELLDKLNLNKLSTHTFKKTSPKLTYILLECLKDIDEGSAKSIEIQGKVLVYLSALVNFLLDGDTKNDNIRHLNIAKKLHSEIISNKGNIPSLDYLSGKYGLSTKSLNENFKSVYGKPIWTYILEHRLNQAHSILSKSDMAIKSIADLLGYANVSHFTNAFKTKYGYPPGLLRRNNQL